MYKSYMDVEKSCNTSGKEHDATSTRLPTKWIACAPAEASKISLGLAVDSCEKERDQQGDNSASPEMSEETTRTLTRIYT